MPEPPEVPERGPRQWRLVDDRGLVLFEPKSENVGQGGCTCENCGAVVEKVGPGGPHGIGPDDPLPWDGTCLTCHECHPEKDWQSGASIENLDGMGLL